MKAFGMTVMTMTMTTTKMMMLIMMLTADADADTDGDSDDGDGNGDDEGVNARRGRHDGYVRCWRRYLDMLDMMARANIVSRWAAELFVGGIPGLLLVLHHYCDSSVDGLGSCG